MVTGIKIGSRTKSNWLNILLHKKHVVQVPASLRLDPMRFATGALTKLAVGASLPDTSIAVLNGAGQRLSRAFLGGQKTALAVTQRLWRLNGQVSRHPMHCFQAMKRHHSV